MMLMPPAPAPGRTKPVKGFASVGDDERTGGHAAAERDGEEEVVIVNAPVAVAVEVREVFDEFDAALLEDAEVEVGEHALDFAAEGQRVVARDVREVVGELEAL